jgi:hypothetical protein
MALNATHLDGVRNSVRMPANSYPITTKSFAGESHPFAGYLCLVGFFLHIILSEPLLNSLGIHYSGEEGRFYEKIHPGSIFIILSFLVLLWHNKNPLEFLIILCGRHTAYMALLGMYILSLFYMALRSGTHGLAYIIDTHMVVPMAAIVLCYTPFDICWRAANFFIFAAVINSLIGIGEAIEKTRIFHFTPQWPVLKETYFRSSAFLGHPLNNAMFTFIALFTALSLRSPAFTKILLATIFTISLVAFGGRSGLVISIAALFILGAAHAKKIIAARNITLLQLWLYLIAALILPLVIIGILYGVIGSDIGERIATRLWWDNSAQSRLMAFNVFHYMSASEIIYGISPAQIMHINDRINQTMPISDIENPWLILCMNFGAVAFVFWLIATLAFILALIKGKPLGLKLTVLGYYLIASTSNSFGRKDSIYVIMTAGVICAARSLRGKYAYAG